MRGKGEGTEPRPHPKGGLYAQVMLGGKRITVYGKTAVEVRRKVREAARRYEDGQPARDDRRKVAAWAETWQTVKLPAAGVKISSQEAYVHLVTKYALPALGDKPVAAVRESDCEAILLAMEAAGLSGNYRRICYAAMRSLFGTAVRERLITVSPMAQVARPKAGKSKAVAMEPEQVRALMANLSRTPTLLQLVPFMALTGVRRGEALGLRWGDVDEEAGVIHLTKQVYRDKRGLMLRDLKTDGSSRDLDLSAPLLEVLRQRRKAQLKDRMAAPAGAWAEDRDLVFTTKLGSMIEPQNVNRAFREAAKRAGLPTVGEEGKVTPHSLRHSVATLLLADGVDEKVVAELLGHSSPRITREVYQHVLPKQRQAAVRRVGEALGW